jgi:peptidyl-prolyl cis-trans isomerase A (cyclophilin A)
MHFRLPAILAVIGLLFCLSTSCDTRQRGETRSPASDGHPPAETPGSPKPGVTPDEVTTATAPPAQTDLQRFTEDLPGNGPLTAHIETSHGTIECILFEEAAPITVANFVGLARGLKAFVDPTTGEELTGVPYFDDTTFHRVIPDFLIQGGDRSGLGHGGPGYTLPDEFSDAIRHDGPGVLSMANLGPGTGGSQFFITEMAAPHLDGRHSAFGRCESPDVIRSISHTPASAANRPLPPEPRILSVRFSR